MKFVCVSDVHIKNKGDKAESLFLKFLSHPLVQESDAIFLLGDIFDLLVGPHHKYAEAFPDTFIGIEKYLKDGKRIYQFEGNHDFHFQNLILELQKKWSLPDGLWSYYSEPLELEIDGRKFLFAHGDEIEIENPSYQKYRSLIRSPFIKFLAERVVPFGIVNAIGTRASKKSRERNVKRYDSLEVNEVVRDRFRRIFQIERDKRSLNYLICGHSHCMDFYENRGKYSNNGYFPYTQTFTFWNGTDLGQIQL